MATYVVSDIHGNKEKFLKLLKKINFKKDDIMYIIGDVIDRGKEPISLLKYISSQKNMILLMGNHEKMMLDGIDGDHTDTFMNWLYNGGGPTLDEYSELTKEEKEEILDIIRKLEYYKTLNINGQKFLLCHAGVIHRHHDILEDVKEQIINERILWNRRDLMENKNKSDYIIIHGHTATCGNTWRGDGKIDFYDSERKINIDCGCGRGKLLGCLCLENFKEFYV